MPSADGWRRVPTPVPWNAAYSLDISGPVVHQIADTHDIQLALAGRLVRAMLHDLITTGTWYASAHDYLLTDGEKCHAFYLPRALTHVRLYQAGHSDADCTRGFRPVRPGARSWLPHFEEEGLPPNGARHIWRGVLRQAAQLDLTVLRPALDYYARLYFRDEGLTASNLATVFSDMAAAAPDVLDRWLGASSQLVRDRNGLYWQVSPPAGTSRKPCVTGVRRSPGPDIERPSGQRGSRAPGSPYLASRSRRPPGT
ncbi:hypothetical protein [Streptomyces sp. NPDC046385]|uniref:hypothetical protein n=1 Tax=Streptomyces sp. NPDC046385 TaxID=3154918 RepID=UPI003405A8D8